MEPTPPPLHFLTRLTVQVGEPIELGVFPTGRRRIVPIIGGTAEGPGLSGTVRAAGADIQTLRAPDAMDLDAHYLLDTDDGAVIEVRNRGVRVASPDDTAAVLRGEPVQPDRIYFRTTPLLSSGHPDWAWLSRRVFVASARRHPDVVEIDVHAVE